MKLRAAVLGVTDIARARKSHSNFPTAPTPIVTRRAVFSNFLARRTKLSTFKIHFLYWPVEGCAKLCVSASIPLQTLAVYNSHRLWTMPEVFVFAHDRLVFTGMLLALYS